MDGWMYGWMYGWMGGWMGVRMDGWVDGWMDVRKWIDQKHMETRTRISQLASLTLRTHKHTNLQQSLRKGRDTRRHIVVSHRLEAQVEKHGVFRARAQLRCEQLVVERAVETVRQRGARTHDLWVRVSVWGCGRERKRENETER
jgi:hypothetical protein